MSDTHNDAETPLKIEVKDDTEANLVVVSLQGKLNIFNYRDLAAKLDALSASRQGVKMVLNLALVTFIASSGWSVFLTTRTRLKRLEGELAFSNMNPDLNRVYSAMKMNELVASYADEKAAREQLLK